MTYEGKNCVNDLMQENCVNDLREEIWINDWKKIGLMTFNGRKLL